MEERKMKKEDTKMYLNFKRIIAVILFVISLSALSGCVKTLQVQNNV